jgi:hypothetical protein
LYRGKVGLDVAEAQHLMDGLDWQGAVKDIQASVNWLKTNGSSKVLISSSSSSSSSQFHFLRQLIKTALLDHSFFFELCTKKLVTWLMPIKCLVEIFVKLLDIG